MKIKIKKKVKEMDDVEQEVMDNGNEPVETTPEVKKPKGAWFSQGFVSAKKEAEKAKSRAGWTPEFWLKNGEEANVRFLTDQPFCIYSHRVRVGERWAERTCIEGTGTKCPLCEAGNKRRFVGCFSIIDRRKESWVDKSGKTVKRQNSVKMWRCGQRIIASLDVLISKRGSLLGYDISVSRAGEGKDSVYNFIPEPPTPLSADDRAKKPIELVKILAPKTRQELLAEMGSSQDDEEEVVQSF